MFSRWSYTFKTLWCCKDSDRPSDQKKVPKSTDEYYLVSLIRLSEDNNYIQKIYELINTRRNKGKKDKYYNVTCKLIKRGL